MRRFLGYVISADHSQFRTAGFDFSLEKLYSGQRMAYVYARNQKGGLPIPRRLSLELELPYEIALSLGDEEIAAKAKEALIMEFLREQRILQGKAAEMLGISRHDLFELMTKYRVSVIDLTTEELNAELNKPFPRQ